MSKQSRNTQSKDSKADMQKLDCLTREMEAAKQKRVERELREKLALVTAELEQCKSEASFSSVLPDIHPLRFQIHESRNKHDAVAVQALGDFHADEVVNLRAMNGLNEYGPKIAEQRTRMLAQGTLDILESYKGYSNVRTLLMALLGDFWSGWIHEELVETNSMPPTEALLFALDLLTGYIDTILASGAVEQIIGIGAVGNHTRITKKPQAKRRAAKSYESILYALLARHYAAKGDDRVRIQCPVGYFNYLNVLGRTLRIHHGDGIRYHGGVGGIHIPLKKAISMWNKAKHADLDLIGHWHQVEISRDYVVNGSLIGYSEYSETIKAEPESPQQVIFLLHNRWGATGFYPLRCDAKQLSRPTIEQG